MSEDKYLMKKEHLQKPTLYKMEKEFIPKSKPQESINDKYLKVMSTHTRPMTLKEKILAEYAKTKVVRQSYQEIAKTVGCNKTYVFKVLKATNATTSLKDQSKRYK